MAFKKNHLEVLVELNKFKELKLYIWESSMGRHVQRREETAWRKKIEEKVVSKEELRDLKEELVALLNNRGTTKSEQGRDNQANLFNLPLLISAAYFASGFFACYLFLSNFH